MQKFYLKTRYIFLFAINVLTGILITSTVNAQIPNPVTTRNYINNVVEIGLSDYGIITAEDSTAIYFIAVRHTANERGYPAEGIATTIKTAKFYNNTYRAKATKVNTAVFGAFTIVLYSAPRPSESKWQSSYFFSLGHKRGQLSTFRDKWMSDKIWAVHNAKINVVKQNKNKLVSLKVPREAGLAKGMPLVNSEGFIAGILAESSLGKTTIRAISMDDIAIALYNSGADCRYIGMVEWGKNDTRCVLEEKARLLAAEKLNLDSLNKSKATTEQLAKQKEKETKDSIANAAKLAKKQIPRRHFIDFGVYGNFLGGPLQVNDAVTDNYFKTRTWHAGIAVYLNIDKKGYNRITLKPGYGEFYERNDPGIWTSPDEAMKIVISSYRYVQMPIVFERKLFQARSYSMAIGAGYSPGYVLNQDYTWTDKTATDENKVSITNDKKEIRHRLLGELYFYESKIGRLGLVYARDISDYPNANHIVNVNGTDYTPFDARKQAWYLGLEVQIRLGGRW